MCEFRSSTCIITQNITLPQVFFKYFASKNQLPNFYISGTLAENGLMSERQKLWYSAVAAGI